ncbi:hypothetical protein GH733_004786 [Mirounga leonina]|nr:hypothetical protein GH733_004786 [Mirounga leonina]
MVGQWTLLLAAFLLPGFLLSEAAKILTVSSLGGSHYLLLDRVSQILQDHGHNVTMLLYGEEFLIPESLLYLSFYQVDIPQKTKQNKTNKRGKGQAQQGSPERSRPGPQEETALRPATHAVLASPTNREFRAPGEATTSGDKHGMRGKKAAAPRLAKRQSAARRNRLTRPTKSSPHTTSTACGGDDEAPASHGGGPP